MKKILFLINGLGLGNSTRCHSIIQQLLKKKIKIGAVLSQNSFWYFKKNKIPIEIYNIDQMQYYFDDKGNLDTFIT